MPNYKNFFPSMSHLLVSAISSLLLSFEAQAMWEPDGEPNNSSSPNTPKHTHKKKSLNEKQDTQDKNLILTDLQREIGYQFKNLGHLVNAFKLTGKDKGPTPSSRGYKRLAFFGDAVLKFIICEILWNDFPHLNSGRLRSECDILVQNSKLAIISDKLQLSQISINLNYAHATLKPSCLNSHSKADFVESLIAAIYEDGGIDACKAFVLDYWKGHQAPKEIKSIFDKHSQDLVVLTSETSEKPSTRPILDKKYDDSLCFLGDCVHRLVLKEYIYKKFPEDSLGPTFDRLNSNSSIDQMCRQWGTHKNHLSYKLSLGKMFLKDGLKTTSDTILTGWLGSKL